MGGEKRRGAAVTMCDNPQPAQSKANHQAEAEQRITRARAALVMEHPFFGSLALRLRLKADPACADMWTDGKTLAYNPIFAAALSADALTIKLLDIMSGVGRRRPKYVST